MCCVVWKQLDSMHVEVESKRIVRAHADADPLGQLVPLVLEYVIYRANPEPISRWLGSMGQCLGEPKPTHLQPEMRVKRREVLSQRDIQQPLVMPEGNSCAIANLNICQGPVPGQLRGDQFSQVGILIATEIVSSMGDKPTFLG